jgi:uncharacterized glyoxalase superfamily protein PhnB
MKTAVEWVTEKFMTENTTREGWHEIFEQAKEMEKEQIINAHFKGQREDIDFINEAKQEAEQYYNKTFKLE